MKKVGFIGVGALGSRIAKRLTLQQPSFIVHVFNGSPAATASLLKETSAMNMIGAASLKEATECSDYIITCLPTSDDVLQCVEQSIAQQPERNCVWMDMSSGDSETSRFISERYFSCSTKAHFMDAPVSGGPAKAETGTLAMMVGCDDASVFRESELDILQHVASGRTLVGGVGFGHALKCINNLLNVSHLLLLSEALSVCQDQDIDIETALKVINASSGRSLMSQERFPDHILSRNYFYDFQLGLMHKDVCNAMRLVEKAGSSCVLAQKIKERMDVALDRFGGQADYTEVARLHIDKFDEAQRKNPNKNVI